MKIIYIAGGMTGIKNFNREAFNEAQECIESALAFSNRPAKVLNPIEMDEARGINHTCENGQLHEIGLTIADMKPIQYECIEAVKRCDEIHMLNGWEKSTGARAEHMLAVWLGKEITYER